MQITEKIRLALILPLLLTGSAIAQFVCASNESEWACWQSTVQAQLETQLARDKKRHPEFDSLPNRPCILRFEVTREREIANIDTVKESGFENFDRDVSELVFFQRHSKKFVFPESSTDTFLRCQISVYPDGKVSPLLIEHPKLGEVFTNTKSVELVNKSKSIVSPPDFTIGEKRK